MLAIRRSAARAAQASRAPIARQSRRYAHDSHGHHHDAHHGPKEEHFSVRPHTQPSHRHAHIPPTNPMASES